MPILDVAGYSKIYGSTIAVADLMFRANAIAVATYKPVELLTTAAIIYFVIAFPVSLLTSYFERRGLVARRRTVKPSLLNTGILKTVGKKED